jgi:hypothetical protein
MALLDVETRTSLGRSCMNGWKYLWAQAERAAAAALVPMDHTV